MNQDQILGIARHVLTTLGGVVVTRGFVDESTMISIVGALVTLAGAAWSVYAKRTKPMVLYVAILCLLLGGFCTLAYSLRRSGREEQVAKNYDEIAEQVVIGNDVTTEINSMSPSAINNRLRRQWERDR